MSESKTIMFDNAGLLYCYDKNTMLYSVLDHNGKEKFSTCDALQAWTYYIQRVDMVVKHRIAAAGKNPPHNNKEFNRCF